MDAIQQHSGRVALSPSASRPAPLSTTENVLYFLMVKVTETVWSKYGAGLTALCVGLGACYGTALALQTAGLGFLLGLIVNICLYLYRQSPDRLREAIDQQNLAAVQEFFRNEREFPFLDAETLWTIFQEKNKKLHDQEDLLNEILQSWAFLFPENSLAIKNIATGAAASGHGVIFRQILRHFPSLEIRDSFFDAARTNQYEIMREILTHGKDAAEQLDANRVRECLKTLEDDETIAKIIDVYKGKRGFFSKKSLPQLLEKWRAAPQQYPRTLGAVADVCTQLDKANENLASAITEAQKQQTQLRELRTILAPVDLSAAPAKK